jgi:alanine dehydrogenase
MVLLVDDSDIAKLDISPEEVIEAVEGCYRQDGLGFAQDTPRMEIKVKGRHLPHIAPGTTSIGMGMAYLDESELLVMAETYHFEFHKYISHVLDPETGRTVAVIKRGRAPFGQRAKTVDTGMLRTGAAAAIGAKYLAKKRVDAVGVIGTGRIGVGSLLCVSKVREFDAVYAHSGRRKDAEYAERMTKMIGVDVEALDSAEEVVKRCDLLITGTYAKEPMVKGEWLNEGTHISGMGADGPMKAEIDPHAFERAARIYIDSPKCFSIGEMARAIEDGYISRESIAGKIGEVVAGVKPGRESDDEITIFESDGTHMQSASVVGLIYRKAIEAELGREAPHVDTFRYNP